MTVTVPSSTPSPLAGAQSLRQRYGRLSPLQLGIYGFVSVGSHVLLLSLLHWAWQVQIAAQPAGAPTGIDFVEVDLSDRAFADQLPDDSAAPLAQGERLTAAQLNALIAQGETARQGTDSEAVGSDDASAGRVTPVEREGRSQPSESIPSSSDSSEADSTNREPSVSPTPTNSANRPERTANGETESNSPPSTEETTSPSTRPPSNGAPSTAAPTPTPPNEPMAEATEGAPLTAPEPNSAAPERPTAPNVEKPSEVEGGSSNSSPLNPLPPNNSDQPISPNQPSDQPNPGVVTPEAGEGNSGNSSGGSENASGTGNEAGPAPPEEPGTGNPDSDMPTETETNSAPPTPSSPPASGESNTSPGSPGGSGQAPRLGANLVVDEEQSRAINTKDVFDQLPRPTGNPLANSSSLGSGHCGPQLAALTPASYGQPVQLTLAVSAKGEVFGVKGVGPQAQTALGQAIVCLAKEWPFEPAKRVMNEGTVDEKEEAAGAVLFVTVTISLLE